MGKYKVRRKLLGTGGARFGSSGSYVDFNTDGAVTSTGDATLTWGSTTSYTKMSACGAQMFASRARPRKDIVLLPTDFYVDNGVDTGSMSSGSMTVAIGGSTFADTGSLLRIKYLTPSADVTGSMTQAFCTLAKPPDADTTGSLSVAISWTVPTNLATTGSKACVKVAAGYFGSGSTIRTAASTGACPAFSGTTALTWQEATIGNLPSFSANDTWLNLVLGLDQSDAGETIGGSTVRISNVRLTYTACALGGASSE